MIDSRYRDRTAYPQPTFCTLRLPRTYKAITAIAMAEIKLVTSFYFFRANKGNTDITIYEKDRVSYDSNNQPIGSTIVKSFLTEGTYNINQLQSELATKLNYTPLFYDYPGGFQEFITYFRASGDLGLNFNEPGDFFFNNTTNTYIANPTKEQIIGHFWRVRNFRLETYSNSQIQMAYYYPVVNEAIQDDTYTGEPINLAAGIGIDPDITTEDQVRERILLTFQGLDDPVVLAVIVANLTILDAYRLKHTFRYSLINKYVINREAQSQRVFITSPSLNTSLLNLLNIQRNKYLRRALTQAGINARQYASLQTTADQLRAVLQGMYEFEQERFLTYFGVPWSQYTLSYYADLNNAFLLQNGNNVVGLASNDQDAIAQNIQPISTNLLQIGTTNPNYYWPNLSNIGQGTGASYFLLNLSNTTSSFQYTYRMSAEGFDPNHTIVDPPEQWFYSDYLTNSANAVCPINAGQYTVFRFHSPVRQTLQVETLMRPLKYRLPEYNKLNYNSTINYYFDMNYQFKSPPYPPNRASYTVAFDNLPTSNLNFISGWSSANSFQSNAAYSWARSYATSELLASTLDLTIATPYRSQFYTFTTPAVQNASLTSSYTYELNLSLLSLKSKTSTELVSPPQLIRLLFYHDRAAFQADVLCNRNENPLFFKTSTTLTTDQVSTVLTFTTYPQQTYYVSVRPDDINYGTTFLKVFPWFSTPIISTSQSLSVQGLNPSVDPYLPNFSTLIKTNFNYARLYDSNYIQLPIDSNLWVPDPSMTTSNLLVGGTAIGYDSNGVSTDYTDYIPYIQESLEFSFNPVINVGFDPMNKFLFQSNSVYDSTNQTFFYQNSLNSLFYPQLADIYLPSTVTKRETKIVHNYSLNYLPEPDVNFPLPPGLVQSNDISQKPYTSETTQDAPIPGYLYGGGEASTIQLGRGVLGWNFIPSEGVWDIKKVSFRAAIATPVGDPNDAIRYLGVYNMGDIINKPTTQISLSNAIAVLSSSRKMIYSTSVNPDDFGFDVKGGTYYEFTKVSFPTTASSTILGYAQTPGTMSDQPESMYSIIAFSEFGLPQTIKALSGSAIPYPFYNGVYTSTQYLDGRKAFNSNYGVVYPSTTTQTNWPFAGGAAYGPPQDGDETQSQFAISIPIGTSVVNYKQYVTINNDSNFLKPWPTPMTPSKVFGTVPDFVMFQDTNVAIYPYSPFERPSEFTKPTWTISADEIFQGTEYTSLVAMTGNSSAYYFLGYKNIGVSTLLKLKTYNPATGILTDRPITAQIPWHTLVKSFTYNDFDQLVLTAKQVDTNTTYVYYTTSISSPLYSYTVPNNCNAYHSMDCTTSTLYWMPQDSNSVGGILYQTSLDPLFDPGIPYLMKTQSGESNWATFSVNASNTIPDATDRIFATSGLAKYSSNVSFSASWNFDTQEILMRLVSTPLTLTNGTPATVGTATTGYRGSLWVTSSGKPFVWVNRNTEPDQEGRLDTAWQIFYPCQKIILEKIANTYNPITDLTYVNYPEYPHTAMFYYRTGPAFSNDTLRKWGLESKSNFTVANTTMDGYYFNSYQMNIPLIPSSNANYQYLTVRGQTPSEASETMIRFSLTNQYNFGYITSQNLIDEVNLYTSSPQLFNTTYANTLNTFNANFYQSTSYFGQDLVPDFDGCNYDSQNFQQFASNMSTVYGDYSRIAVFLQGINTYINSNVNIYISTNLQYIFPPTFQQRQSYSDPLPFSILWKSSLLPQYLPLLEDWGLGYNLGFAKRDTGYSTYHRAESFYKILEDYIYLRLNPEYPMNKLDSTDYENFNVTRDSTGQVNTYFGKLLLNDFNTYSRSFVNNQLQFNPPIPRLDQMYFQWVNAAGIQIDNVDCEWAASLTITESKTKATAASMQAKLPAKK